MRRPRFIEIKWLAFDWMRPFEPEAVTDVLTHLAAHTPQTPIIFEVRGSQGRINYYLGADRQYMRILTDVMKAHGDIRFIEANERMPVNVATQLKITKPRLALNTDNLNAVTRAGLAALMQAKNNEQSVLQIILGPPYSPSPMPQTSQDPHASWVRMI